MMTAMLAAIRIGSRPDSPRQKPESLQVGAVCVVSKGADRRARGTYRLDRVQRSTDQGRWSRIIAVASGTPIRQWTGRDSPRTAWYAIAIDGGAPATLRMRDLWEAWIADGQPSWRSWKSCEAYVHRYIEPDEVPA